MSSATAERHLSEKAQPQFWNLLPDRRTALHERQLAGGQDCPGYNSAWLNQVICRPSGSTTSEYEDSGQISRLLINARTHFVDRVEQAFMEDVEEVRDDGGDAPTDEAIRKGVDLARRIAAHVAFQIGLRSAGFVEDTGTVSIVLQSARTDRRLNFRICRSGSHLVVDRIDEHMVFDRVEVPMNDSGAVRELIAWVTERP